MRQLGKLALARRRLNSLTRWMKQWILKRIKAMTTMRMMRARTRMILMTDNAVCCALFVNCSDNCPET